MIVKSADADRFIGRVPPKLLAALIFGPDQGLVRDINKSIVGTGTILDCNERTAALAESIYPSALAVNSRTHGIRYQRQAAVPANDRGKVIGAHKLDFVAGNTVALGPLGDVPYRLLREGVKRSFSETYLSAASGSPWLTCFRQCWI